MTIGVGAAIVPDYEGSDDYRIIPAGAIRGKVSGISFITRGTYLYVDVDTAAATRSTSTPGRSSALRFDSRRHIDDDGRRSCCPSARRRSKSAALSASASTA